MNCILESGIALECLSNTGGIRNVYIGAYSDDTAFTYGTDGEIDTVTSTESFYTFKFRPQTSGFTEEATISVENGTNFFTQNVTMTFHKMDAVKRNTILLLLQTTTHVVVEDQNGLFWWVGLANGANMTTTTTAAGTSYGDLNGYSITVTGLEPTAATNLSDAGFATLTIV